MAAQVTSPTIREPNQLYQYDDEWTPVTQLVYETAEKVYGTVAIFFKALSDRTKAYSDELMKPSYNKLRAMKITVLELMPEDLVNIEDTIKQVVPKAIRVIVVFAGHGVEGGDRVIFSDNFELFADSLSLDIYSYFQKKSIFVFSSCYTGVKGGVAHILSKRFKGIPIFAPLKETGGFSECILEDRAFFFECLPYYVTLKLFINSNNTTLHMSGFNITPDISREIQHICEANQQIRDFLEVNNLIDAISVSQKLIKDYVTLFKGRVDSYQQDEFICLLGILKGKVENKIKLLKVRLSSKNEFHANSNPPIRTLKAEIMRLKGDILYLSSALKEIKQLFPEIETEFLEEGVFNQVDTKIDELVVYGSKGPAKNSAKSIEFYLNFLSKERLGVDSEVTRSRVKEHFLKQISNEIHESAISYSKDSKNALRALKRVQLYLEFLPRENIDPEVDLGFLKEPLTSIKLESKVAKEMLDEGLSLNEKEAELAKMALPIIDAINEEFFK